MPNAIKYNVSAETLTQDNLDYIKEIIEKYEN